MSEKVKHIKIDSLDNVLLDVREEPAKPMIFALIQKKVKMNEPGEIPEVDLVIESYVRMLKLSKELQKQIRKELKLGEK